MQRNSQENKNKLTMILVSVVVFVVLFAMSWSSVDPLYYGLKCNSITKKCDQKNVYDNGRYLIGPLNYFLHFPSYYKSIEFSNNRHADSVPLKTRTKEGLSLQLHITFQYHIVKDSLPELYKKLNLEYEANFIRIARNVILQQASNYEAPQYWTQRDHIANEMKINLNKEFNQAFAECRNLQLLIIDLPDSYESMDTQVQNQMKYLKEFEQQAELIRQEIKQMQSKNQQEINIINAGAQADSVILRQTALASAQKYTIDAENQAYQDILANTKIDKVLLNNYIVFNALMDNKDGKILYGVDNAIVNNSK